MSHLSDIIPQDLRQLRACMICSLVKTNQQFLESGCDNCDQYIGELAGDAKKIAMVTTPSFEGMVAMMIPSESWVARWQRITKFTPGMYAIAVQGTLPPEYVSDLAAVGYKYIPRHPTN